MSASRSIASEDPALCGRGVWPGVGKARGCGGGGGHWRWRTETEGKRSERVYREAVGGAVGCGAVTAMWASRPRGPMAWRGRSCLCLCFLTIGIRYRNKHFVLVTHTDESRIGSADYIGIIACFAVFGILANMRELNLSKNQFNGSLPKTLLALPHLKVLDLSENSLVGGIPISSSSDEELASLEVLNLSNNNMSGALPTEQSLCSLIFRISNNQLGGDISHGLFSAPNLMRLDMRYNKLTGNLSWLEDLDNINVLSLGWNEFEGQVTSNLCKLCPRIIDLSHNKLSGSLRPCLGRIFCDRKTIEVDNPFLLIKLILESYIVVEDTRGFTFGTKGNQYTYGFDFSDLMSGIDLSANMLYGEIPWDLRNLSHIKALNLSNNFFSGQIPASIANMSEIESLDMSHNELTGSIPWQLTRLWMLEVFSVAYNNLSGCIPNSGQFGSFAMDSYQGNSNLHKMLQGDGCSSSHGSGAGDMPPAGSNRVVDDPVLYAVSAASFVLVFWATVASMVCHPVGRHIILRSAKMVSWCCR
ncbi:hypothetical protein C2845_PM10G06470 [Panicum miliaceum]|uniref:Uncharacterized protein n=1 Tax=Panicum miliaceum TaxID=4540 RepID=A0A3L6PE65_PANMI|nr:hypothetical protein C2845_PM10G06470 [Panicum miliaceum]